MRRLSLRHPRPDTPLPCLSYVHFCVITFCYVWQYDDTPVKHTVCRYGKDAKSPLAVDWNEVTQAWQRDLNISLLVTRGLGQGSLVLRFPLLLLEEVVARLGHATTPRPTLRWRLHWRIPPRPKLHQVIWTTTRRSRLWSKLSNRVPWQLAGGTFKEVLEKELAETKKQAMTSEPLGARLNGCRGALARAERGHRWLNRQSTLRKELPDLEAQMGPITPSDPASQLKTNVDSLRAFLISLQTLIPQDHLQEAHTHLESFISGSQNMTSKIIEFDTGNTAAEDDEMSDTEFVAEMRRKLDNPRGLAKRSTPPLRQGLPPRWYWCGGSFKSPMERSPPATDSVKRAETIVGKSPTILSMASANVGTLQPQELLEARRAGLALHAIMIFMDQQFHDAGFSVVFVQASCIAEASQVQQPHFVTYSSASSDDGQSGTEIWIHRDLFHGSSCSLRSPQDFWWCS